MENNPVSTGVYKFWVALHRKLIVSKAEDVLSNVKPVSQVVEQTIIAGESGSVAGEFSD